MALSDVPLDNWIAASPHENALIPIQLPVYLADVKLKVEHWAQKDDDAQDIVITHQVEPPKEKGYPQTVLIKWNNSSNRMIPFDYRITILN